MDGLPGLVIRLILALRDTEIPLFWLFGEGYRRG
jgi:hypothetical protein